MMLYHVTRAENLSGILKDGIKPELGERSLKDGEHEPLVHAFMSHDDCENGLMNWLGDEFDDDEVLCILAFDTDIPYRKTFGETSWECTFDKTVPPECIKAVMDESWEPFQMDAQRGRLTVTSRQTV